MARTKTRTAPEPAVEDNGERDWSNLKDKDTTWMHEAFSEFIEEEAGIKVPPKHVQAVTAMRVAFRQSDTYLDAKAEAKAEQEQEQEPEPEPKARRSRTAKAKAETAKPARSRRSRAGKAEPEVTVGKDDEPAPKATRSRRTRRTAKTTEEPSTTPEAPF